jgi:hypothetical protein
MSLYRFQVVIPAIATAFVALVSASLFAQASKSSVEHDLQVLRTECRAELSTVVKLLVEQYAMGGTDINQPIAAHIALLQFDLENETDTVRRIELLEKTLESASSLEKLAAAMARMGNASNLGTHRSKALRMQTQIKLLLEKQKL